MGSLEELLFLGTLMALGAFSIDVMLPALEATAHRYGTSPTAAQLVVASTSWASPWASSSGAPSWTPWGGGRS